MGTLIGNVDLKHRPLVRLELPGDSVGVLALLDTGFNGELIVPRDHVLELGFQARGGVAVVELAGGHRNEFQRGRGTIIWLGQERQVEILISSEPTIMREGDPVAIVGTRLLAPHLLLIDFGARTVEVEAQC